MCFHTPRNEAGVHSFGVSIVGQLYFMKIGLKEAEMERREGGREGRRKEGRKRGRREEERK